MSDSLKKFWLKKIYNLSMFYIYDFFIEKMSELLISSFLVCDVSEEMSDHERNARVAHQK